MALAFLVVAAPAGGQSALVPMTPGGVIGHQLGQLGRSMDAYSALAAQRAQELAAAREALARCGTCPQREMLRAQVRRWENIDSSMRTAEGDALRAMGIRGFRDFEEARAAIASQLLGREILTARQARERQQARELAMKTGMIMNYCVALNPHQLDAVDPCIAGLPIEFLDVRDAVAHRLCREQAEADAGIRLEAMPSDRAPAEERARWARARDLFRACTAEHTLWEHMQREIHTRCGALAGLPYGRHHIEDTCDPAGAATRAAERRQREDSAPLVQSATSTLYPSTLTPAPAPGSNPAGVDQRIDGIIRSDLFRLLHCGYAHAEGQRAGQTYYYWHERAPANFAEIYELLGTYSHPARVLGTRGVSACPATAGDARRLTEDLQARLDPPSEGLDRFEVEPVTFQLYANTVSEQPHRNDTPLDLERRRLVQVVVSGAYKTIRCVYLPRSGGFRSITFWKDAVPPEHAAIVRAGASMPTGVGVTAVSECPGNFGEADVLASRLTREANALRPGAAPAPPAAATGPGQECPNTAQEASGTFECFCAPSAMLFGQVVGTDTYTTDSSYVCRAARHAGAVGETGGVVRIAIGPGRLSYSGSTRNGVASLSAGPSNRMFAVSTGVSRPVAAAASPGPRIGVPAGPACPAAAMMLQEPIDCTCPAAATQRGLVYGTEHYTNDSNPCRAAVHAGAISAEGGVVRITPTPGRPAYAGSTANGVTSSAYGPWRGSFTVQPAGASTAPAAASQPAQVPAVVAASAPQPTTILQMQVVGITAEASQRFNIRPGLAGVVLAEIPARSFAFERGFRPGDVVTAINNMPVSSPAEMLHLLRAALGRGERNVVATIYSSGRGPQQRSMFIALDPTLTAAQ
jgi:hypothetical protein